MIRRFLVVLSLCEGAGREQEPEAAVPRRGVQPLQPGRPRRQRPGRGPDAADDLQRAGERILKRAPRVVEFAAKLYFKQGSSRQLTVNSRENGSPLSTIDD